MLKSNYQRCGKEVKDASLVVINKRNNTNSYAVNYDSQWEAVQV